MTFVQLYSRMTASPLITMPSALTLRPWPLLPGRAILGSSKSGNANDPEHSSPSYLNMDTINWSSFRLSSLVSSEQRISQHLQNHHVVLVFPSVVDGLDCHR
jgi:hypothetical protein